MQMCCFTLYFLSLILDSINGSCLQELLWYLSKGDFSIFYILYIFINNFSTVRESCPFSLSSIYISRYITVSMDPWTFNLFFALLPNSILVYRVVLEVPALAIGCFFRWASLSFQHVFIIFWTLKFWNPLMSHTLPTFPVLAWELTISPKSPHSFYRRMMLRNQEMGAKCVHWY